MKHPFIGQMDREIQLVLKKPSQSGTGAETFTDEVVATPWAYMQDVSGTEETEGKIKHLVNRTYTIRFDETVKQELNALILIDEEQRFEVIHILELGRRKHLEIRVKNYE